MLLSVCGWFPISHPIIWRRWLQTGGNACHDLGIWICRRNLDCGHPLPRPCVVTISGKLCWDHQLIFCVWCLNLRWKQLYVRQKRQSSEKRWRSQLRILSLDGESWCPTQDVELWCCHLVSFLPWVARQVMSVAVEIYSINWNVEWSEMESTKVDSAKFLSWCNVQSLCEVFWVSKTE